MWKMPRSWWKLKTIPMAAFAFGAIAALNRIFNEHKNILRP